MAADDAETELELFDRLAQAHISLDMISIFPERKSFTITEADLANTEAILKSLGLAYRFVPNCAKVAVVGLVCATYPE